VSSGRVLLMTYIGGIGYFIGPIIGAIVLTLMNSLLSNYTELWLLYLGIMFLLTVMFLPRGFAGFIMMHQLAWVRGKLKALLMPYLITAIPALLCLLSTIALIEMAHASEQVLDFFGMELSTSSISTWLAVTAIVLTSAYATRRSIDQLRTAWNTVNSANDDENG
jgi:branched-chain amino acid transport system permease protein